MLMNSDRYPAAASVCLTAAPRNGAPRLLSGAPSTEVHPPTPALPSPRPCSQAAAFAGVGCRVLITPRKFPRSSSPLALPHPVLRLS